MAEHPPVSIIIPCHNAGCWIREAIGSCLQQAYPNLEVIVVDDGSSDHSPRVLQEFGSQIRVETGPNRGACHARNRGIVLSRGEYLQFLDADDYLLPGKVERQVRFLQETGADAVYGDWRHCYHHPDGSSRLGEIAAPVAHPDILLALLGGWWVASHALLYRREVVGKGGGWDETFRAGQDADFLISLLIAGAAIRYQPGCGAVYRRYGDVTLSTSDRPRWLASRLRLFEKAEISLARAGLLGAEYREALAATFFRIARGYYDIDRTAYQRLMRQASSISPEFRPRESALYNAAQRVLGSAAAELLASSKRRLWGRAARDRDDAPCARTLRAHFRS